MSTELTNAALRAKLTDVEARWGQAISALHGLLAEPYGCSLCDSGKARNPVKGHQPDCPYEIARDALKRVSLPNKAETEPAQKEETQAVDASDYRTLHRKWMETRAALDAERAARAAAQRVVYACQEARPALPAGVREALREWERGHDNA